MTACHRPVHTLALVAACAAGACLTAAAYWPGFMTWDAIRQYDQALNGDFDDWHPPMMEWLWRRFLAVSLGPAPMLVTQLALEWLGFALLGMWALRARRPRLAGGLVACGFLPFALALSGEVLKDCLMAGALLAATGLLAWQEQGRRRAVLTVTGVALLVFAATLRFNAFLATVPLCVALLPAAWVRTRGRLFLATLAAFALMVAALPVANRLIGAQSSDVSLSLVIFDLGGITRYSGEDAFPKLAVADPVAANATCYNPERWDPYSWWVDPVCPINFTGVQAAFRATHTSPYVFWLRAILLHPLAYAEHRLVHFNGAVRLFARVPSERGVQLESPPNDWGYRLHPGALVVALDAAAVWTGGTPLGWPAVWIAGALGLLVLAPALPTRRLVLPLACSAVLYGLGYGVFGVASELRYHLWTILAAALAAVIAQADVRDGARVQRWRAVLAAGLPSLAIVSAPSRNEKDEWTCRWTKPGPRCDTPAPPRFPRPARPRAVTAPAAGVEAAPRTLNRIGSFAA